MQLLAAALISVAVPLFALPTPGNPYAIHWRCQPADNKWSCSEVLNPGTSIFDQNLTSHEHEAALSQALGWVPDNSDTQNQSVCGGHYYEQHFADAKDEKPLAESVSKVLSNVKNYTLGGKVELKGDVEIMQPGRRVYADHIVLYPTPDNPEKPQKIEAKGNVRLSQPGQLVLGKSLEANLYTHKATLQDVYYLLRVKPDWSATGDSSHLDNFTGYARGHADSVQQLNKNKYVFHSASYTTAPPGSNTWELNASKITLDRVSGRGVAENALLRLEKIPVFYFPYFSFPLTNKRQSGFLYGSIGSTSKSGASVAAPYYFNIAPNFDDTLTPNFLSKRGVLFENEFRYLTKTTKGELRTNYLPNDKKSDRSRWFADYHQYTQFNPMWNMDVNLSDVSDRYYFDDLEDNNVGTANLTYLDRHVRVQANTDHWHVDGIVRDYKIVNPDLNTANRPYDTLPSLTANALYPNAVGPFELGLSTQVVNFEKEPAGNATRPVDGQRLNVYPTLGLPMVASYGYLKPSIGVEATGYQLENTAVNDFPNNEVKRAVPIAQVDSTLHFDRTFQLKGHTYSQTVSPRLYYAYVPYHDQNDIPVFDTSVIQFNFDQLFSPNRFNGIDRVGDTNRLSYALSTSLDNDEGMRLFSAQVGQAAYFAKRRVSLCRTAGCIAAENNNYDRDFSDIAASGYIMLSSVLKLSADLTYNQYSKFFDTQDYQLQYHPDAAHLFNIGFSSNRRDFALLSNEELLAGESPPLLSQVTTSFLWKVDSLWRVIGSWNYSTNKKRTVNVYGGFEYSPCSWAVRFIWRKFLLTKDVNNPDSLEGSSSSGVFLQFQLKGLGNLGSSKIQYLAKEIPGYQKTKSGF